MHRTAGYSTKSLAARMAGALFAPWLAVSVGAVPYNATPANVDPGGTNGLQLSDLALGDYNNDGRLDVLALGRTGGGAATRQLRIYTNTGAGTFNAAINVTGSANTGFQDGGVKWGDFDGDGFLDVLVNGLDSAGARQLRVYFSNNAGGTGTFTAVNVPGAANLGMNLGRVGAGDFDLDGDLDVLACGSTTGANAGGVLRVYPALGGRAFGAAVAVAAGGYTNCDVAAGDFNNDGLMDVLVEGADTAGTRRVRVYRNTTTNHAISFAQVADFATGLSQGSVAWGDLNNDGFLDIVAEGSTAGSNGTTQLQFYLNNGAGGFGAAASVDTVTANGLGLWGGGVAVGDTDNDGDVDILASGRDRAGTRQLRVYRNNGATPTPSFTALAVTDVAGAGAGYRDGGVAWGDVMGADRKIDILVSGTDNGGTRRLRVFTNTVAQADVVPTAPAVLASTFAFSAAGASTATFKWDPGTDTAPGATPANTLVYDLQVSTTAAFTGTYAIPGQGSASPLRGNYYRPPKIYDGNTRHGVVMVSTSPWLAQTAPYGLRTDTTYYFRVKTCDAGLTASAASASSSLWTGVAPSSVSDLTAGSGPSPDNITLSWSSPGDDATKGNLTGTYRIQYSTVSTTVWSPYSTPAYAFTVTVGTSNVTPGTLRVAVLSGLQNGATYYIRLWTQDDANLWSAISNAAQAVAQPGGATAPGTTTNLAAATGASPGQISLTWMAPGDDGFQPGTWATGYDVRYSTTAAQSPATSNANFTAAPSASAFGTIPSPAVEGSTENMALSGLAEGVTYYFALKSFDASLNLSGLSNGATTWAQRDTTTPGKITDLAAAPGTSPGEIDLTWTAVGDDGYTPGGTNQSYDIRYSTTLAQSPALSNAAFAAAASVSAFVAIPGPSVQGAAETLTVPGLTQGVSYYFAIKAADENPNTSPLSAGATALPEIPVRDLVIDATSYTLGNVAVGLSTQTTSDFTLTYNGNVSSNFIISASTVTPGGSPWTLGATPAADRVRLYAAFNSAMPASASFGASDVVLFSAQTCTSGGLFAMDQDCFGVSDGDSLSLWFRLDMPTSSSATAPEEQIQVTITAGP